MARTLAHAPARHIPIQRSLGILINILHIPLLINLLHIPLTQVYGVATVRTLNQRLGKSSLAYGLAMPPRHARGRPGYRYSSSSLPSPARLPRLG